MEKISLEQAVELALAHTGAVTDTDEVPLLEAPGRILAEDMAASFDNPPFDRSPIDGYACRAADVAGASKGHPARLEVAREIDAGQYSTEEVGEGQAVRIMTGAAIPPGCDCCIRQEDTDYGEKQVCIYRSEKAWGNYCFKGEDFKKGSVLLEKGRKIGFLEVGILAGMGKEQVPVLRLPRAAVFSTGDEVVHPGQPLPPGKIYDSNQALVSARLLGLGVEIAHVEAMPDNPAAMAEALTKAAEEADLVISTGAVSVGKKDIMHEALAQAGAQRVFWRVLVKPGMPTLFSVCGDTPILSLSGNPFGVVVMLELLARPMLQKQKQDDSLKLVRVTGTMAGRFGKASPVRRFVRAFWDRGIFHLPKGLHSNGALASMAGCNCLLDIPPGTPPLEKGDTLEAVLL